MRIHQEIMNSAHIGFLILLSFSLIANIIGGFTGGNTLNTTIFMLLGGFVISAFLVAWLMSRFFSNKEKNNLVPKVYSQNIIERVKNGFKVVMEEDQFSEIYNFQERSTLSLNNYNDIYSLF